MKLLTAILSLIAGMNVVFGGEPEPVLDGKICYLRWRFSDVKTEESEHAFQYFGKTRTFE